MDDDNYVNVRMLVKLLSSYPHTQDIYIGKPSLDRPIQATERISENKMVRGGHDGGTAVAAAPCGKLPWCWKRGEGGWGWFNVGRGLGQPEEVSLPLLPLSRSTLCISGLPREEQGFASAGGWR